MSLHVCFVGGLGIKYWEFFGLFVRFDDENPKHETNVRTSQLVNAFLPPFVGWFYSSRAVWSLNILAASCNEFGLQSIPRFTLPTNTYWADYCLCKFFTWPSTLTELRAFIVLCNCSNLLSYCQIGKHGMHGVFLLCWRDIVWRMDRARRIVKTSDRHQHTHYLFIYIQNKKWKLKSPIYRLMRNIKYNSVPLTL